MASHDGAIRFEDGAGYEQMMGRWSRLAAEPFLDWLAPAPGLCWVDVGCGNGAFTQAVVDRCAPASVDGFDPSEAQLAYARSRPAGRVARFRLGDAMAAPYPDASFDIAAMALVLFFVPDPAQGLREMVRVLRPGGTACAYVWDMQDGGFPLAPLGRALKEMGVPAPMPPSVEVSRLANLRGLWEAQGLRGVETLVITVERRFDSFEALWSTALHSASIAARVATLAPAQVEEAKQRFRDHLRQDTRGPVTCTGRANAVRGVVPG